MNTDDLGAGQFFVSKSVRLSTDACVSNLPARCRFLIVSLMVFFMSIITSDAYLHGKIYTLNMCAAGWSALALDAIRMPYKIVLYTVWFS